MQLHLLFHYKRYHKNKDKYDTKTPEVSEEEWPFVTVQLPIYNEMFVVERLIDNICEFEYPKSRLEIHVLDDSTDETLNITKRKVEEYAKKGFQIKHITRKDRKGYKAGALKEGTKFAKGDFIAIFDADFLPKKDFLKSTIPYFKNAKVGVVQTRWGHINQNYSLITKLQAFQLNVHFTIEQKGRSAANYMCQFNGTAGVWRKETIANAGGWEADTLTEDLDLSYRAQLKGWEIVYLEEIVSPAELPAEMNGLKSQQFRWMKGGAETAKKMLPTVWKSDLNLEQKLHASIHLLSSSVFIFIFILGVFSVPLLLLMNPLGINDNFLVVFFIGLLSIIGVYYVGNVEAVWKTGFTFKSLFKFLFLFPVFLSLSMGLSLHNSIAVLQGYFGRKSPFIRTPKFNINSISDTFQKGKYLSRKIPFTTVFEGLLSIYFLSGVIFGIFLDQKTFLMLHLLLMMGFGTIFYYSVKHVTIK
jgi:cellulose synthase/poly-beta-1,6-N-acetylglucosamine synthase-like glycosyltransferase